MKRIIGLLSALCLLFGTVPAMAKTAAETVGSDNKYDIVYDLGILSKSANPNEWETRGGFVDMLGKLADFDGELQYGDGVFPFADVTETDKRYRSIRLLYEMNVIYGDGSGMFFPDEALNADDAAAMMLRFLGFAYQVKNNDFYTTAAMKKLFSGVKLSDNRGFTVGDTAKIAYNILYTDMSSAEMFRRMNIYYDANSGNFLEEYLHIYEVTGTVTDDGEVTYSGESKLRDGYIAIDGVPYINKTDITELLGYYVRAYCRDDRSAGESEVLAIRLYSGNSIKIAAGDIDDYSQYIYTVYSGNAKKSYKLESSFVLRYNGRIFSPSAAMSAEEFKAVMMPKIGSVTLADANGNGTYDYVDVKSYETLVLGSISYSDDIIMVGKFDTEKSVGTNGSVTYNKKRITIDEDADVIIHRDNGSALKIGNIIKDSVVAVAKSYDGKYAEIIVSDNKTEGVLTMINGDTVTADGKEYKITDEYKDFISDNPAKAPSPGAKGRFYLTFDESLVYFDGSKTGEMVYAMLDFSGKIDDGIDEQYGIRVCTQNNELLKLKLTKKTTIDGAKRGSGAAAADYISGKNLQRKLILVSYNDDLEAINIDTPYSPVSGAPEAEESENSLQYMKGICDRTLTYVSDSASFYGQFLLDENSYVFALPEGESVRDCRVIKYSSKKFQANVDYKVTPYTTNSQFVAEAIVVDDYYSVDPRDGINGDNIKTEVIEKISRCIGDDGNFSYEIQTTDGYYRNIYTTESEEALAYYYDTDQKKEFGLEPGVGDIISFGTEGTVIADKCIVMIYDYSEDKHYIMGNSYESPSSKYLNTFSTPMGWVYDIDSGYIELSFSDPAGGFAYEPSADKADLPSWTLSATNMSVVVFDKKRETVMFGNHDDLTAYLDDDVNYSCVHTVIKNGAARLAVVYK